MRNLVSKQNKQGAEKAKRAFLLFALFDEDTPKALGEQ